MKLLPTAHDGRQSTYVLVGLLTAGIIAAGVALYVTLTGIVNQAGVVTLPPPSDTVGLPIEPPRPLMDFTMPASTGGDISLSELTAGHWTVMFFGYTHCPDFCPATLADYRRVKAELGDTAAPVQFVFVSVDGQRDSPDHLARYLAYFDPDFIGLSGDDVTLAQIRPDYGFVYERRTDTGSAAAYLVDHSTRSYLIDPQMRLRTTYGYATDPVAIAEDIRHYVEAG